MLRFLGTSAPTLALPLGLLLAAAWGGAAACGGTTTTPDDGNGAVAGTGDDNDNDNDGTSSGGGSASGGSASGTGGGNGVPCVDVPCNGRCEGTTCGGEWTCVEDVPCTDDIHTYCGCDGASFVGSGSCPAKAFAHDGPCDLVNCDPADITCLPIVPVEPCPQGQAYSVVGNCHGSCVPIAQCGCSSGGQACPDTDQYVCHSNDHCDYYVH